MVVRKVRNNKKIMEAVKEIPYGMADFTSVREQNRYYVDKTMYIPLLESQANYLILIRPRRFGKSLLLSMLRAYYDLSQKERFQQLFGDLWIGQNPTSLQGTYQILYLDFSKIGIPLSFQPSELAKFVLVLYMASFMSKRPQLMASFSHGIVPMLIIMGVFGILLLLQKNMSMMVIMVMTGAVMLFFGGARMAHLVTLAGIAAPVMVIAVLSEEYRKARMTMFWDPWTSKADGAYQLRQSLIALGSGGIFGKGLNFSRQKLLFLPYGESDFIFAIIGEELGLIGCVLLMGAYAFLVYRGIRIAMRCKDRFGSLLAAGITSVIGMQAIVNIAVATSSAPTTGQTLPFISAGGTSLVIFLSAAGILLNVSRNTQ